MRTAGLLPAWAAFKTNHPTRASCTVGELLWPADAPRSKGTRLVALAAPEGYGTQPCDNSEDCEAHA